ncbi:uncharacterized protein LOC144174438 [Haemaphysalis longicornis]
MVRSHIAITSCRSRFLGYCIRNHLTPPEVTGLFGLVRLSAGHARRVCKVLRSELWRQERLLYDWLRVTTYGQDADLVGEARLRSFRRLAAQAKEFLWQTLVPQLPKSKGGKAQVNTGLVVLGNAKLPAHVEDVPQKSPKFSLQPRIPPHELLTLNRRVAEKAEEEERERCLLEVVDCLLRTSKNRSLTSAETTQDIVRYFKDNDLVLLQADKEGGFVVLPSGTYGEKACQAVQKNFSPRKVVASKVKASASALCKVLSLDKLAKSIS